MKEKEEIKDPRFVAWVTKRMKDRLMECQSSFGYINLLSLDISAHVQAV